MTGQIRRGRAFATLMLVLSAVLYAASAMGAGAEPAGTALRMNTLTDAWLAYNGQHDEGAALYSFISLTSTRTMALEKRKSILKELDDIGWRLENSGLMTLRETLKQWQQGLARVDDFRFPGRWDLASVLSKPLGVPPLERVATLGNCSPPDWVEVWDSRGINRYRWHSGQALSSLLDEHKLELGRAGRVAVVSPSGSISRFGLQAWSFADASLVPGSRVVASLPLRGQAFPWLRDAIARFLSYVPPGDRCNVVSINHSGVTR